MFFLTAADTERLNIRGSRDPLGFVPIWGDFGRKVVQNLTTASNSARGFTTLLLGLHFAERVAAGEPDRETVRLAAFLKFEQLAGFARVLRNEDESMRGITQIKRRLDEGEGRRFRIGAAPELQILSNQKTYGLWGLFIMPAIESGLVVTKDLNLTPAARELVEEEYLPQLKQGGRDHGATVESLLAKTSAEVEPNNRHKTMFDVLGHILSKRFQRREREFYHYHLILGGEKAETRWQPRFATLLETILSSDKEFSHRGLAEIIKATDTATDRDLHYHLLHIRDLEALLVAAANLFGFLQQRDNGNLRHIVAEFKSEWGSGLRHIKPDAIGEMQRDLSRILGSAEAGERLVAIARSLNGGRYQDSIELILMHNKFVMASRNGSQPWLQRVGDRLEVRYKDGSQKELPSPSELVTAWQSSFYIDPLKNVSDQLRWRH